MPAKARAMGVAVRRLKFILAMLFYAASAQAENGIHDSQMSLRTGMVSAGFSGSGNGAVGSFSVFTSMDLEYEKFTGPKSSYLIRTIFAFDQAQGRVMYSYAGFGRRFYFGSSRGPSYEVGEGTELVSYFPGFRFFAGFDAGLSRVVVDIRGTVYESASALFDFGGHMGIAYPLTRNVSMTGQLGYSYGYGFSSVSVGATIMKALLGVSIYL